MLFAAVTLFASVALLVQGKKYQVIVGVENAKTGFEANVFYPPVLKIHPGDSVVFRQIVNEPHTVTFYEPVGGLPPLIISAEFEVNPLAVERTVFTGPYDGTSYANSGFMSKSASVSPDKTWEVPFGAVGDYKYACILHGIIQNGTISVVDPSVKIPAPKKIRQKINKFKKATLKKAKAMMKRAKKMVPASTDNGDGTKTHYILLGYMEPPLEFTAFIKKVTNVRQGDILKFAGKFDPAVPIMETFHTVTFLNGAAVPPLFVAVGFPPKFFLNPDVGVPKNPAGPLTRTLQINSGAITANDVEYSIEVGDMLGNIQVICIPHFLNGMKAKFKVLPRKL